MLVVGRPAMALFRPRPGGGYRHRSGQDVRTLGLLDPGEGYRLLRMEERTLGLPDPGGGCRFLGRNERKFGFPDPGVGCSLLGVDERNLGIPDPEGGRRHRSCCLLQECLQTQFLWLI